MTKSIRRSDLNAIGVTDVDGVLSEYAKEMQAWIAQERMCDEADDVPLRPKWEDFAKSEDPAKDFSEALASFNEKTNAYPARYPKPTCSPIFDGALNDNYEPDYMIVEDDQREVVSVDKVLEEKKARLKALVSEIELQKHRELMPFSQRRLLSMEAEDVARADADRMRSVQAQLSSINVDGIGKNREMQSIDDDLLLKKSALERIKDMQQYTNVAPDPKEVMALHDDIAKLIGRRAALRGDIVSLQDQIRSLSASSETIEGGRSSADSETMKKQAALSVGIVAIQKWLAEQEAAIDNLTDSDIDAWMPAPLELA